MITFMMFGNYDASALAAISARRTQEANALIKEHGGKTKAIYALLGGHDLVLIVELEDVASAMRLSVALAKLTGVSFNTYPALDVKEFDKLVGA